jgi:hypothetical protein
MKTQQELRGVPGRIFLEKTSEGSEVSLSENMCLAGTKSPADIFVCLFVFLRMRRGKVAEAESTHLVSLGHRGQLKVT